MSIFFDSIKKGLDSAMTSRNQQIEINGIIGELSKQVAEITDNLAEVKLRQFQRAPKNPKAKGLASILERESYEMLCIFSGVQEEIVFHPIVEWFQGAEGYPVKIAWQNVNHTCNNRQGLENLLMKIVEEPSFGVIIRDIIYENGKTVVTDDGQKDGQKFENSVPEKRSATRVSTKNKS